MAWFAAACARLYYVAGTAFYVFALCAVIFEFYSPGKRWSKLGLIVVAGAARLAVDGVLAQSHPAIFYLHIPNALPFAAERSLNAIAGALLISFPLWAFLVAEWTARRREPLAEPSPEMPDGVPPSSARYSPRLRWATETVLFLGVATLVGQLAVSRGLRTVLTLHDCADSEQWDEVLSLAPRVPPALYSGYVDSAGQDHKPFVLPQSDPRFYDTCLKTYNVPELVTGPVTVPEKELLRAVKNRLPGSDVQSSGDRHPQYSP